MDVTASNNILLEAADIYNINTRIASFIQKIQKKIYQLLYFLQKSNHVYSLVA